jgi:hypothetical protein
MELTMLPLPLTATQRPLFGQETALDEGDMLWVPFTWLGA